MSHARKARRFRGASGTCFGFFWLWTACSLDERRLQGSVDPGSAGAAGSSTAAGGGLGAAQGMDPGDAGASGDSQSAQPPIPTVGGCPDLDTDTVADCDQTQITNPDFGSSVAGWVAEAGATLDWAAADALSSAASGCALVTASSVVDAPGSGLVGASQCLPVLGKQLVIVYANAFVDAGQDSAGEAALNVTFFDSAGCAGVPGTSFTTPTPLGASPGTWQTVQAGSLSADSTHSAKLLLALSKPLRGPAFQARFDNVLFKELPAQ